jgi:AraC family transcriptional regulator
MPIRSSNIDKVKTAAEPSRFEKLGPLLLVGLREPLTHNAEKELPILWQRFMASLRDVSHRVDGCCYGLCMQTGNNKADYYYMACCAVSDFTHLNEALSPIIIPSQNYAVFVHHGHLSDMRKTISVAFDDWLPASNWNLAQQSTHSVHFFEKYTEEFDIAAGVGGIEIWLPVTTSL